MKTPFYLLVYKTFHAQKNRIRPGMGTLGLSTGQPKVLSYLMRHESCLQKELAEAFDIRPATISHILSNMEEKRLIYRQASPGHRRAISISITPRGREAHAQWQTLCHAVEKDALAGFSPQEQEAFSSYLCRMYHNLTGNTID